MASFSDQELKTKLGAIGKIGSSLFKKERELLTGGDAGLPDAYRKSLREGTFSNIKDPFERAQAQIDFDSGARTDQGEVITADNIPVSGRENEIATRLGISPERVLQLRKEKEQSLLAGGGPDVPQDLDSAYQRSLQSNRFEDIEAEQGKDARAQAQLKWEKSAAGIEFLQSGDFSSGGGGAGAGAGGAGGGQAGQPTTAYKDSQAYQDLPDALKDLVDTSFATLFKGEEADFVKLNEAIKQAQAIVDPFFAAQLALTRASLVDSVARTTKSFEFGQEAIKRIRDELIEDISLAGEQLGLEEQAQLSSAIRQFDTNVLDLRDAAAQKGTTFGEGRLTLSGDIEQAQTESAEIIQSTRRKANFQRQELSQRAQQGDRGARAKLAEGESDFGFDLQDIGRRAEEILGSTGATGLAADAPELSGVNFVGGVLGNIEVQRQQSFARELGVFFDAQNLDANLTPNF